MFGKNEIVGKKWFRDNPQNREDKLFVTSMFMTLQGEGPFRGEPAFFIRLAKCNLNCIFCDSFFDDGDWLTFDQIEERIEETIEKFYADKGIARPIWTKHGPAEVSIGETLFDFNLPKKMVLVMTGGEPMLQDNILPFLDRMNEIFDNTQIESNGTQSTEIPESTTLVVSPKCAEKNGAPTKYLTPRQDILDRADCLKFVMDATEGSPYSEIPEWAHDWANKTGRKVFVSPMNIYNDIPAASKKQRAHNNSITLDERSTVDEVVSWWTPGLLDMEANQKNHEHVGRYCVEHGFVFNMQLHLFCSMA